MKEDGVNILPLDEACEFLSYEELKNSLAKICLESAASPVAEGPKREEFLKRWLFQYLEKYPEYVFCALEKSALVTEVLGYILACPTVQRDFKNLDQKGLDLWQEFYCEYPAHLHINCAQSARGKGVGSKLLSCLELRLRERGVLGVHLVTAKGARNVGFYERNTYRILSEKELSGIPLLLLGKLHD